MVKEVVNILQLADKWKIYVVVICACPSIAATTATSIFCDIREVAQVLLLL